MTIAAAVTIPLAFALLLAVIGASLGQVWFGWALLQIACTAQWNADKRRDAARRTDRPVRW